MNTIERLHKTRMLIAGVAMLSLPILMPSTAHAATSVSACRTAMKACIGELEGTAAVCALEAIDDGATTLACISAIVAAGTTCNITNLENACATSSFYPDNTDYATTEKLGSVAMPTGITKASLNCPSSSSGRVSAVRSRHDGNRIVALDISCGANWVNTDLKVAGKIAEERQCRNGEMVGGLKGKETNYSVQSLSVMCTSYDGTTPYNYTEVGTADAAAVLNTMACSADSYIYGLDYYYQTNSFGTSGFYIVGIAAKCRG